MKDFWVNFKEKAKHAWKYSINTWIFKCFAIAFVMELVLEMLGRRSVFAGLFFMLSSPYVYLYNVSIIFFTLLFALFLKKRLFGLITISFIWLTCGVVNFIVLGYRITPFAAIDFLMAKDVLSMIDMYLTKWQQVLVVILIVLVLIGIIVLFIKSPKFEGSRKIKGTMLVCIAAWIGIIGMTKFAVKHNFISDDFANLGMAYKDYGFAYCFTNSIIDNGIEQPDDYSKSVMRAIKKDLDSKTNIGDMRTPNIIYIQLESFFDPSVVSGLTISENPIPNFTALKAKYPSGYLTMPALGAGTANSEYEVITSMKSSSFGAGEYPYKTTVNKKPVVGVASIAKSVGYTTFAIHNNTASFYDRQKVYEQMGFDYFTSIEYMYDTEQTSTGWTKDYTLVTDIMDCLNSTEGKDLVYAISVQGHGKYPTEEGSCEEHVTVSFPDDEEKEQQYNYYVNQIYEMDEMIGMLIKELDKKGEDYVLVLYGDHLPTLIETEDQIGGRNLFQTEYIIVNNINLNIPDADIDANELSGKIFKELCLPLSYAQKANLYYSGEERAKTLYYLAYDMLFGDRYMYYGVRVFPESTMTMGVKKITVDKVEHVDGNVVVTGQNFNEYSVIYVNDEAADTTYVDHETLIIEEESLENGDIVIVNQVDSSHHILGGTEEYVFAQ